LKVLLSKTGGLVATNGPSIQFELEGLGATKKQLNQIQCICTDVSPWATGGAGQGPICSTAFTDTQTPFPGTTQTHTERLRIQPSKFAHVIVDGGVTAGGPGGEQGWSAPEPEPGRMIHWSDDKQVGQMSYINDIQYSTGPCAQQAGLALAHDSGVVTHRGGIQAENTEGWLITPPHVCSLIPDGPGIIRPSILCTSTYGMIGNTLLGTPGGLPVTIDNIFVTAHGGSGGGAPPTLAQTPCQGTQLILTKVERTNQDLIINDATVGGGNIRIGLFSPWPQFAAGQYRIMAVESVTISFIWNTLFDGTPGASGQGWHCTGFHTNV
jgi:hypothetical protein